jgi:bifunctional N-acetylglucosamine-1-phosphate-uridyltransferase/glucosamine-1-phosphate-acetyltransferase GlmU-like protein
VSWRVVVAALDSGEAFRSRVSAYLHPLAGRPLVWHVVHALSEVSSRPDSIEVLYRASQNMALPPESPVPVRATAVEGGKEVLSLRAAVTKPGLTVLIDGLAALVEPSSIARLLRAGEQGIAMLGEPSTGSYLAVCGEGPALASGDDPRLPVGAVRVAATSPEELIRVTDRHALSRAGVALRDRLVRQHEQRGVTFVLPQTTWIDVDVRIGSDTVIYPGVVLEGMTEIGVECVIGPHSRLVEAVIGKGVELKGWNYVTRTRIRNHAVLEPYVRRGYD